MTTTHAAVEAVQGAPEGRSRYFAESAATSQVGAATGTLSDLQKQRSQRLRLLGAIQRFTTLDRVTHCRVHRAWGWEFVGIVQRDGLAQYAGLQTCESPWVCPPDSARIRHRRALGLSRAVVDWVGAGGGLLFPTLTLAHLRRDPLEATLGHLLTAWRYVVSNGTYKRLCKRLGIAHSVRAVEITYGRNGWHPHLHLLLFTVRDLTDEEAEEVRSVLFTLWLRYVERHQLRLVSESRAVLVRRAGLDDEGRLEALGKYLAKVQDGYGIAAEVVRGDVKRGRKAARSPFQIAESAAGGNRECLRLWAEYEQTTHGRHVLEWSKGAKVALGYDEQADDEAAQADDQDLDNLVYDLTPYEWSLVVRYRRRGYLLNAADNGGPAAVQAALDALRRRDRYEAAKAARKGLSR